MRKEKRRKDDTLSVWTQTPSTVSTMTRAPSVTRRAAVTSLLKSTWPGESADYGREEEFSSAPSRKPSQPSHFASASPLRLSLMNSPIKLIRKVDPSDLWATSSMLSFSSSQTRLKQGGKEGDAERQFENGDGTKEKEGLLT